MTDILQTNRHGCIAIRQKMLLLSFCALLPTLIQAQARTSPELSRADSIIRLAKTYWQDHGQGGKSIAEWQREITAYAGKLQGLAKTAAASQQPDGHWNVSTGDTAHVPASVASETASYAYAILSGINNGLLSKTDYMPTVSKAWTYLTHTALQRSGKVDGGQPAAAQANPAQADSQDSRDGLATAAFLLAAEEYRRWLTAELNPGKQVAISISNPCAWARQQVVEADAVAIRQKLGIADGAPFVVKNAVGQELTTQFTHDGKLLIDASVQPHATWTVYASAGMPKSMRPSVFASLYKMRKDDIAWENDRCAYRVYGPALQQSGEKSFGIDVWVKNTPDLIVDKRYNLSNDSEMDTAPLHRDKRNAEAAHYYNATTYHLDHGDGMDCYSVGATLGCGTPALIDGDKFILPYCYADYKIIENGPLRVTFTLRFGANANGVVEHREISLDKGSHFNKVKVWYDNIQEPVSFCAGVVHNGKGEQFSGNGFVTYADPTDRPDVHSSEIYVATLFPYNSNAKTGMSPDGKNGVCIIDGYKGEPVTYYAGAAWSRFDIANFNVWKATVETAMEEYKNSLSVSIR